MTMTGAGVILAPFFMGAPMRIDWDSIPDASAENMRAADMLIRTDDGLERRTAYDGGWMYLHDATHTAASKQSITAGTPTLITIDGLAADTITANRRGVPLDLWSGNTMLPQAAGEAFNINLTMRISKATSTATYARVEVMAGSGYATAIAEDKRPLIKGSGVDDFLFFSGNLFVTPTFGIAGARFFLTCSEDVTIWDKAIFIQRTFTP